jgi:hypothetical protein
MKKTEAQEIAQRLFDSEFQYLKFALGSKLDGGYIALLALEGAKRQASEAANAIGCMPDEPFVMRELQLWCDVVEVLYELEPYEIYNHE